jgi:hypothetical protein
MNARRFVLALATLSSTAILASSLSACTSNQSNDNTASPTAVASKLPDPSRSATFTIPVNPYDPAKLLTQADLQALTPSDKLTNKRCTIYKNDYDRPTNLRTCEGEAGNHVASRLAVTVDNSDLDHGVRPSQIDASGLLADVGGSTGRQSVSLPQAKLAHGAALWVFVKCDPERTDKPVSCPKASEVKTADRILIEFNTPGWRQNHRYVTMLIGVTRHDIPVERLIKAANTAVGNLQEQFKKGLAGNK